MSAANKKLSLKSIFAGIPPVVWVLLVMVIAFARLSPDFLTVRNAVSLMKQGSILMTLCMGVIVVKITGGIELAVGGVMSLAGMVMAYSMVNWGVSIPVGLLLALLTGLVCGVFNGIFVAKMNIPSFIATLGMQFMATGIALVLNGGNVIWGMPKAIGEIGNGNWLGVPVPILLMLLACIVSFVVLRFTTLGVYFYSLGGNEDALKLAGRRTTWYKILAYVYCGLMVGLAAIIITSRNQTAQPTVGVGMEFEAFSSCVLGGAIAPGKGSVSGTILGVLFILILRNGLNVVGVPTFYQLAVIGVAIIGAIVLSMLVEQQMDK